MELLADWNGAIMPLHEVRVSVLDRAFQFGDGVYEVLRLYAGRPFLLREHMDRLRDNLQALCIPADVGRIEQRLLRLVERSGVDSGQAYLQMTRGEAPRQHAFPVPAPTPNELIYVRPYDAEPKAAARERGGRAITQPDLRWKRCDIKSLNLLANCLAAQAAVAAGCDEALLITDDNRISEGAVSSVFAVQAGQLLTSPLEANILPGITRGFILGLAATAGIAVRETEFHVELLRTCDELFITSTSVEVLPIISVDGTAVGTGQVGPVTRQLQAAYRAGVGAACS